MKNPLKECYVCHKTKPLIEFCKNKASRGGYENRCKECYAGYKHNRLSQTKEARIKRFLKYPWFKYMWYMSARCLKHKNYKNIKRRITAEEVKTLWIRDKAHLLKKPSIDRINSKKDYTFDNCRFIELSENSRISSTNRVQTEEMSIKKRKRMKEYWQRRPKVWAVKHSCCIECGTTKADHMANGHCERCYHRLYWRKRHSKEMHRRIDENPKE